MRSVFTHAVAVIVGGANTASRSSQSVKASASDSPPISPGSHLRSENIAAVDRALEAAVCCPLAGYRPDGRLGRRQIQPKRARALDRQAHTGVVRESVHLAADRGAERRVRPPSRLR
jgi:hypothetical protein